MLQAVQLPAGIADLTSGLPQVNRDDLAHGGALALPVNVDLCTGSNATGGDEDVEWGGVGVDLRVALVLGWRVGWGGSRELFSFAECRFSLVQKSAYVSLLSCFYQRR